MFKKIFPCLLLSSLFASSLAQANICFADITDFKKQKDLVSSPSSVSLASYLGTLKRTTGNFKAGSQWVIKSNQLSWIVSELVAAPLYQSLLGKNLVSEIYLLCSKNNNFHVAMPYNKALESFKTSSLSAPRQAGDFPFTCILNGCRSTSDRSIQGFEKALLASVLLYEDDIKGGNNFALIDGDQVTRVDFDDSLKFFDLEKISPGLTEAGLHPTYKKLFLEQGHSLQMFLSMLNQEMSSIKPNKFIKEYFKEYFSDVKGHFQVKKLLAAGLEILEVGPDLLNQHVDRVFNELGTVIPQKLWNSYYTIPQTYVMTGPLDPYAVTQSIFQDFISEKDHPVFSSAFHSIHQSIIALISQVPQQSTFLRSGNFETVLMDQIEFSFGQEPIYKKLATIAKAHLTYNYIALYRACKQWKTMIDIGHDEL